MIVKRPNIFCLAFLFSVLLIFYMSIKKITSLYFVVFISGMLLAGSCKEKEGTLHSMENIYRFVHHCAFHAGNGVRDFCQQQWNGKKFDVVAHRLLRSDNVGRIVS